MVTFFNCAYTFGFGGDSTRDGLVIFHFLAFLLSLWCDCKMVPVVLRVYNTSIAVKFEPARKDLIWSNIYLMMQAGLLVSIVCLFGATDLLAIVLGVCSGLFPKLPKPVPENS